MTTSRTHAEHRPRRYWLWGIAVAVLAVVLGAWWLALDRFATQIGLDAESTMRELPRDADTRHRSD